MSARLDHFQKFALKESSLEIIRIRNLDTIIKCTVGSYTRLKSNKNKKSHSVFTKKTSASKVLSKESPT
jgi:hypothetical protein